MHSEVLGRGQLALLLIGTLALSGCLVDFSDGEHHASRSVKLSEAMKTSAAGETQPIAPRPASPDSRDSGSDVSVGFAPGLGLDPVSYDDREYNLQIVGDFTHVIPFRGDIARLDRFALTPFAFESERGYLALELGGSAVELKPGSLADRGAHRTWALDSGVEVRWYVNGSKPFLSPYLLAGLNYQQLFWSYRNPILVSGEQIGSDSLGGVGGFVGVGVAIERNNRLSLFGETSVGGTLWLSETEQGFQNDVFDNYGYVAFRVGLSLKF